MLKSLILSLFCLVSLTGLARAQAIDPAAALTESVGQAFQIPMIGGRLLASTITNEAQRHTPAARRQPDTIGQALAKGWGMFGRLQAYRSTTPTFEDSVQLAGLVLDQQGRLYMLSQLGVADTGPSSSAKDFETWIKYRSDEFHRVAFQQNMVAIFGANPPVTGDVLIEAHVAIDFGSINPTTGALQIRHIDSPFSQLGALTRRARIQIEGAGFKRKENLQLPPSSAADIVRALGSGSGTSNRRAFLVIRGRLSLSDSLETPSAWTPESLVMYLDPTLQQPLPGFSLLDFYIDLGAEQRAAQEAAARRAAEIAQRAAEAALARATTEEQRRFRLQQHFAERSLDVLGLTLGMEEAAARALLADRYSLGDTSDAPGTGLDACSTMLYRQNRDLKAEAARLARDAGLAGGEMRPEDAKIIEDKRKALIAQMPAECHVDRDPLSTHFTGTRSHAGGITDEIRVYLGESEPRKGQVIAVARALNWNGAVVDVIAQMTQKYGAEAWAPNENHRYWLQDLDSYMRMEDDLEFAKTCVPYSLWQQSGTTLPAQHVARPCGPYLALAAGSDAAEIQLVDAAFISAAMTTAQQKIEAAKTAPAVEIEF